MDLGQRSDYTEIEDIILIVTKWTLWSIVLQTMNLGSHFYVRKLDCKN